MSEPHKDWQEKRMKCVYKIGRLFLITPRFFDSYDSFLLSNLQYDEETDCFFDMQGHETDRPVAFHAEKNVLFLNFVTGIPDLDSAVKVSEERAFTVWKAGNNWIYSDISGKGWLKVTSDYRHATYYQGYPDEENHIYTFVAPVNMAIQCSLVMQGYLVIHAAAIEENGKGVLFSADSGVGKSTRARLWTDEYGASFISGDRPIIDPVRGRVLGAPWDGKEKIYRNIDVPITAFNCLQRAEQTKVVRMTADEKKRLIAKQTFIPMWDPMLVSKVFFGIDLMLKRVNIWKLACNNTVPAIKECHDIIFPKEPENIIELIQQLKATDTPMSDYRKQVDDFMEFKARKLAIPYFGTFELTPLCNMDCKMCYVHLNKSQMGEYKLLDVEQWKKYIDDACDAGMKYARLTGGECLTYSGFDDIYIYLQEHGINITVLTNGLLLDEKRIEFFKKHPVKLIQVSLYGSNDDVYEKVTGVRCFEKVLSNVVKAKEANLPIMLAVTPNTFYYEDIPNILRLAKDLGIKCNINSGLDKPRKNTGRELCDLNAEQYVELFKLQAQIKSVYIENVDSAEIQEPPVSGEKQIGIKCGAGRSNFAISWNGRMMPCPSLSEFYISEPIKNFMDEWKKVNKWAEELILPGECANCAYRLSCIQCIAKHYDPDNPGHCNKEICKRMMLSAEAGLIM